MLVGAVKAIQVDEGVADRAIVWRSRPLVNSRLPRPLINYWIAGRTVLHWPLLRMLRLLLCMLGPLEARHVMTGALPLLRLLCMLRLALESRHVGARGCRRLVSLICEASTMLQLGHGAAASVPVQHSCGQLS